MDRAIVSDGIALIFHEGSKEATHQTQDNHADPL